jgi:hypothetical protein
MWTILVSAALAAPGPFPDDLADAVRAPAPPMDEPPACASAALDLIQLPDHHDAFALLRPDRAWGTTWLVDALAFAAARVRAEVPWADPLRVGDLSAAKGGPLPPHRQHRDGRDADVGLWSLGGRQSATFEPVRAATLDVAVTWLFIDGLLETGRISMMLLDPRLIERLRSHVVAHDLLVADDVAWVFGADRRPGLLRGASRHSDHLHVQVSCSDDAVALIDRAVPNRR